MIFVQPAPLAETAARLRTGDLDLRRFLEELCDRVDATEPFLHALLPEPDRRARLLRDAAVLQSRFPDPAARPPLYGIPVGVKDIFRVDGFLTRAGSNLPPELFAGPEAACVCALSAAGALILGKTVTTEFAYFEPGPTRNPHNLDHTPGGSSSGSAAAVAAGFCPLALGTQTIGSTIRPAAFCGIVGFKPSYGRIPTEGLIFCAPSLDHIGLFTQDLPGMALAASILCGHWQPAPDVAAPVLGAPDGPYLDQAAPVARAAFEDQLASLQRAGIQVRRVPTFEDIAAITRRHLRLMFGEMAETHAPWFARYAELYRPRTTAAIREGQSISAEQKAAARAGQLALRAGLERLMDAAGVDLWVSPAAPGPAPHGLDATGNPAMNLPWTQAGLPTLTLPAGRADGLPLGLQCSARFMADERLLQWAMRIAAALHLADLQHS